MLHPKSWHIELTSRCALECPGCDRTWFKKTFKQQIIQDIDVNHLTDFFIRNNFLGSDINLCGNNGDPIYHPKFIEIIRKLKKQNHRLRISTNGSAKNKKFWQTISNLLDDTDEITFAIDGLEDTNHLYRKNAKWSDVMLAIQQLRQAKVKKVWKFIPFSHNIHQIDTAEKISVDLGFDRFLVEPSDRWMDKSMKNMMPKDHINHQKYHQKLTVEGKKMQPQCLTNKHIYIDSDGAVYPCCWSASHRFKYKTPFGKIRYNIEDLVWTKLFTDKIKNFLNSTQTYDKSHLVCKMHCGL